MSESDALTHDAPPERIPLSGGDEQDALTRASRHVLRSKPGRWKASKRSYNRRLRKTAAQCLREAR